MLEGKRMEKRNGTLEPPLWWTLYYRYQELIEVHNHESFLQQLPTTQHKQDEKAGDLDMGNEGDPPVTVAD